MAPRGSGIQGGYLQGRLNRLLPVRAEDRSSKREFGHSRADLPATFPGGPFGGRRSAGRSRHRLLNSAQEVAWKQRLCRGLVGDASWVRYGQTLRRRVSRIGILGRRSAGFRSRAQSRCTSRYAPIRALAALSAQYLLRAVQVGPPDMSRALQRAEDSDPSRAHRSTIRRRAPHPRASATWPRRRCRSWSRKTRRARLP
jgi:hypothetical protein